MVGKRVFLLLALFLLVRIGFSFYKQNSIRPSGVEMVSLSGVLNSEPRKTSRSQIFSWQNYQIVARRYPELGYGDRIKITGEAKRGKLLFPRVVMVAEGQGWWVMAGIYELRRRLVLQLQRILPEPEAGLAAGILLGYKAALNSDFKLALQRTGLTHVVAASGMNLTLVAGAAMVMGKIFFNRRRVNLLAVAVIWFYVVLEGFDAAVVRAAIMVTVAFGGVFLGRQTNGFWGLGVAVYLMVFWEPTIIFDLGFQLSVAAMAGILIVGGFRGFGEFGGLKETIIQTIAAQVATMPLILGNFGMINIFSFIINALVLWTVPYIMGISALAGIGGLVWETAARVVILPAHFLLGYFVALVTWFSRLDAGLLRVERLDLISLAGMYMIMGGVVLRMRR